MTEVTVENLKSINPMSIYPPIEHQLDRIFKKYGKDSELIDAKLAFYHNIFFLIYQKSEVYYLVGFRLTTNNYTKNLEFEYQNRDDALNALRQFYGNIPSILDYYHGIWIPGFLQLSREDVIQFCDAFLKRNGREFKLLKCVMELDPFDDVFVEARDKFVTLVLQNLNDESKTQQIWRYNLYGEITEFVSEEKIEIPIKSASKS